MNWYREKLARDYEAKTRRQWSSIVELAGRYDPNHPNGGPAYAFPSEVDLLFRREREAGVAER
jgi:hypothetical protein